VLPMKIHTVEYEDMVNNSESVNRRLIEFVGLSWQSSNAFSGNNNPAKTVALLEAEKEMEEFPAEHWCYYEKYLQPLKNTLAVPTSVDVAPKKDSFQ